MDVSTIETLARIDERVGIILKRIDEQKAAFDKHVEQDREDFKEVHSRVSASNERMSTIGRKQSWMLGLGTGLGLVMGVIGAWLRNAV